MFFADECLEDCYQDLILIPAVVFYLANEIQPEQ